MKNVTLTADHELIAHARLRAQTEKTTLNALFRHWLAEYAGRAGDLDQIRRTFAEFDNYGSGGRKFSRDEMNAR